MSCAQSVKWQTLCFLFFVYDNSRQINRFAENLFKKKITNILIFRIQVIKIYEAKTFEFVGTEAITISTAVKKKITYTCIMYIYTWYNDYLSEKFPSYYKTWRSKNSIFGNYLQKIKNGREVLYYFLLGCTRRTITFFECM